MTVGTVWFRRDLRLADNPTLRQALAECDEIIPLFVVDDHFWGGCCANRRWFLTGCLADLDEQLGGGLVIRHGDPVAALADLVKRHGVTRLYRAADAGPAGRRRDAEVDDALRGQVETIVVDQPYVAELGSLRTSEGTPFKVFTPYWRRWRQLEVAPTVAPARLDRTGQGRVEGAATRSRRTDRHGVAPGSRRAVRPRGARSIHAAERRALRPAPGSAGRRRDEPARSVPQVRVPPPPPTAAPPRPRQPEPRDVRPGARLARLLRRRSPRLAGVGMEAVQHGLPGDPQSTPSPWRSNASLRGAPDAQASRSSTPACVSSSPKASSTTVCG